MPPQSPPHARQVPLAEGGPRIRGGDPESRPLALEPQGRAEEADRPGKADRVINGPWGAIVLSFIASVGMFLCFAMFMATVTHPEVSPGYGIWTTIATLILCVVVAIAAGMK